MIYYIYICVILLVFANIKSLFRVIKTSSFLRKEYNANNRKKDRIAVIIPAMNEVNNVKESVSYFKSINDLCDVIYVTTSKEKSGATYNKIKEEIKNQKTSNIEVVNCPNIEGTMANQLNYVIKELDSEVIIAIYNIDSKPEIKTFQYVISNINDESVLQQVSYFDDKLKGIVKSAQNWQNRWSITYEIGKYLNNNSLEFKYVIGHGLFFKKKIIDKIGYFSEKEINEDNEFGYRLNINRIKIKPIPYMEKADFARNKKIYIKQQSTWVNGPLYAFRYYKNNERGIRNFILSILNFKAFLSWWLFPLLCYSGLVFSLFVDLKLSIVITLLTISYVTVINYLANKLLMNLGYIKQKYRLNILSDLLFFMIHSFGSYITIFKLVIGKNNIRNKYNTEK